MKRFKLKNIIVILLAFVLCIPAKAAEAATYMEIDDEEYNLYVDEYPDEIYNNIYAKFKSSKSNYDDYYLNLSSEESHDKFTSALDKAKIGYKNKLVASMTAALYKMTDDEDKKVTDAIELLLPLPDDTQEHPEDAALYMVSSGTAKPVSYTLVIDDYDVYYAKFQLTSYTTYGFLYNDPDSYEDEEYDDYEDSEDDEDLYIDETPTPTEKPTPTPSPTPVPKPTSGPVEPTTTPKPTASIDSTASDTHKGSTVITQAPSKEPANSSPIKDSIPKTGDNFPLTELLAVSGVSLVVLCFALYKLKK